MDNEPIVFLVAGDAKARRFLKARLSTLGPQSKTFRSTDEFLHVYAPGCAGCVLLDVSGSPVDLDLLPHLGQRGSHLPVIAISEHGSISTAVRAMKLGAMDFLEQSCSDARLAETIEEAFRWDADNRRRITQVEHIRRRLSRLATGHREVLDLLVAGKSNREIAAELELSVRSIEVRRAKVMQTMRARSLAELVRLTMIVEGCWKKSRADREESDEGRQRPIARDFSATG